MVLDDLGFEFLKKKIGRDRGFNCDYYKESVLRRRIMNRMRSVEVKSFRDYAVFLDEKEGEYDLLIDTLTVNVTEFFRDPTAFQKLGEVIIPNLIFYKWIQGRRVIRVWSAGCSSGEEPYSLSILFNEYLSDKIDDYRISINATDIDRVVLDKAEAGLYPTSKMKNVDSNRLSKFFDREGDMYQIKDKIKESVKFRNHDLISGEEMKYFDMLLCRNVLIYFSRDKQDYIFTRFFNALNPSGYMMIGKTETLTEEASTNFELIDLHERIYRKPAWSLKHEIL